MAQDKSVKERYVTRTKFATICGMARQSVFQAVEEGRLVMKNNKIDMDHPTNSMFMTEKLKTAPNIDKLVKKVSLDTEKSGLNFEDYGENSVEMQAIKAKLNKLKADAEISRLKALQLSSELISRELVQKKIFGYFDLLSKNLFLVPKQISSQLISLSKSSKSPKQDIEAKIEQYISKSIQKAKKEIMDSLEEAEN